MLLPGLMAAGLLMAPGATAQLQPGQMAPDFELKVRGSGQFLRLSDFQGVKPVALIFGSFT